jgi:phage terminase large subunit-like protein
LSVTTAQRPALEALAQALEEKAKRQQQRLFFEMYPDEDIIDPDGSVAWTSNGEVQRYGRGGYLRHMEFFAAGAKYRARGAICANRTGKTFGMGGYETTAHLTGLYPGWWEGRRFDKPVRAWAVGESFETTRSTVQKTMLGNVTGEAGKKTVTGTGLVPGRLIGRITWRPNDSADTVQVRHVSGGWSVLGFKAYEQGASSFAGTAQHVIWCDEDCPEDVWGECVTRTATTNGIIYLTVTPLKGMWGAVTRFFKRND